MLSNICLLTFSEIGGIGSSWAISDERAEVYDETSVQTSKKVETPLIFELL